MRHPRIRELLLLLGAVAAFAVSYVQLPEQVATAFFVFLAVFGVLHIAVRLLAPRADPVLLPMAALLIAIGSMQLAAIDRVQSAGDGSWDPLAPLQAGWLAVGGLVFIGVLYIFREGLGAAWRVRYTLALLGVFAIFSPMLPFIGHQVRGARLWVQLGPLSFQPGEIAKILLVLFFAAYLAERRELLVLPTRRLGPIQLPDPRYLAPLLGIVGLALMLFVRQNDLGTPLLFFLTFMAILWVATGKAFYPLVGIGLFLVGLYFSLQLFPHVASRFPVWLNPDVDPTGAGYQVRMGYYGMAEGGLTGTGLAGSDSQPHLIPFAFHDLIFASIGHTLGLAGTLAVLMTFLVLLTRIFFVALRSSSDVHALAVAGFGIIVGLQAGMIAGGVVRVLPLTGITLPFVSYGGSSLVANFAILGCILAASNAEATTDPQPRSRAREEVGV